MQLNSRIETVHSSLLNVRINRLVVAVYFMYVAFEVFGANSLVLMNVVLFHTTSNHFNSSEW